jgi:hypothetical protein
VTFVASMSMSGRADAVTWNHGEPHGAGQPVSQVFIDPSVSLVRTAGRAVCVLSGRIDIASSRYTAPGTGEPVPFATVTRSLAASVQAVGDRDGGAVTFRIQLKYSPAPDRPMRLAVGDFGVDIAAALEPSGDSFALSDQPLVARIRAAMAAGEAVTVEAVSRDTGRLVQDRLPVLDFASFDACRDGTGPQARHVEAEQVLTFEVEARADPATRTTPEDAAICRLPGQPGDFYRGRLVQTTGFVSPTATVFVAFDRAGRMAQVYVPGILDARSLPDGSLRAEVSRAANRNTPGEPATVSGCLGAETVMLCEQQGAGPGSYGPCLGSVASESLLEGATFLSDFTTDGYAAASGFGRPAPVAGPTLTAFPTGAVASSGVGGGAFFGGTGAFRPSRTDSGPTGSSAVGVIGGGSGSGGGGSDGLSGGREGSDNGRGGESPRIPAIPLPLSGLLLASALGLGAWWTARWKSDKSAETPSQDEKAAASSKRTAWRSATTAGSSS